jgi:hypothetical protein
MTLKHEKTKQVLHLLWYVLLLLHPQHMDLVVKIFSISCMANFVHYKYELNINNQQCKISTWCG